MLGPLVLAMILARAAIVLISTVRTLRALIVPLALASLAVLTFAMILPLALAAITPPGPLVLATIPASAGLMPLVLPSLAVLTFAMIVPLVPSAPLGRRPRAAPSRATATHQRQQPPQPHQHDDATNPHTDAARPPPGDRHLIHHGMTSSAPQSSAPTRPSSVAAAS